MLDSLEPLEESPRSEEEKALVSLLLASAARQVSKGVSPLHGAAMCHYSVTFMPLQWIERGRN